MTDVESPPDEEFGEVDPEDPLQQRDYIQRFCGLFAAKIQDMDRAELEQAIINALHDCPRLKIRDPRDVLRFLRLRIFVMPALRSSPFLTTVTKHVLYAIYDWSATKRFDFLDKYVIDRPLPEHEPDFGPWSCGPTVRP
jgi:hypothetical protein